MMYWGIVGLGKIAHHFVRDLALVPKAVLYAVASRAEEKAYEFAKTHKAQVAYGNYEDLFDDPKVQIVYIATPHSSHALWTLAALKAGKHVLCEKPLGMNLAEVLAMTSYAKEKNLFLMEALWTRFNPSIIDIVSKVRNRELGPIEYLHADFGFYAMDFDPKSRVLDPELGGGSLLDIGIYPIFLSYLILGMPTKILASAAYSDQGTEIKTAIIFDYDTAKAVLYSGFTSKSAMVAQISGAKGLLTIKSRWHETQGYRIESENNSQDYMFPTIGRGYAHEIEAVQDAIFSGKLQHSFWTHQNSIDLATLLSQVQDLTKKPS